jgi:hypothetical protein
LALLTVLTGSSIEDGVRAFMAIRDGEWMYCAN